MITRRKFSEVLKRGTLQRPCQKIPVVESVFNKIASMDSRPAFMLKRSFHQGRFSVDTSEFSAILQSGLT